jgi:hypothetical protein
MGLLLIKGKLGPKTSVLVKHLNFNYLRMLINFNLRDIIMLETMVQIATSVGR